MWGNNFSRWSLRHACTNATHTGPRGKDVGQMLHRYVELITERLQELNTDPLLLTWCNFKVIYVLSRGIFLWHNFCITLMSQGRACRTKLLRCTGAHFFFLFMFRLVTLCIFTRILLSLPVFIHIYKKTNKQPVQCLKGNYCSKKEIPHFITSWILPLNQKKQINRLKVLSLATTSRTNWQRFICKS